MSPPVDEAPNNAPENPSPETQAGDVSDSTRESSDDSLAGSTPNKPKAKKPVAKKSVANARAPRKPRAPRKAKTPRTPTRVVKDHNVEVPDAEGTEAEGLAVDNTVTDNAVAATTAMDDAAAESTADANIDSDVDAVADADMDAIAASDLNASAEDSTASEDDDAEEDADAEEDTDANDAAADEDSDGQSSEDDVAVEGALDTPQERDAESDAAPDLDAEGGTNEGADAESTADADTSESSDPDPEPDTDTTPDADLDADADDEPTEEPAHAADADSSADAEKSDADAGETDRADDGVAALFTDRGSANDSDAHLDANAPAIELRGLTKNFGDVKAVDSIDLVVPAGSFFGLVGPNGAGKTTTLSMIGGLLTPDGGSLHVAGVNASENPQMAKRMLGVLPDRLRTFDRLTGRQLLYYYGVLRGLAPAIVESRTTDLARAFDLGDSLGRVVSDYSAGMAKKVMLAGALIHSPRVLVLDEPFEAVDPMSSAVILDILTGYVAHGGTVLLSSHGMDFVERVCSRVAVIVAGRVLADGTIDEVRGESTLEQRYLQLAGGLSDVEGLEWLHTFSD